MAKAIMETAAEKYRRIRREKESAETLHDVTCSDCGMEWKARRVGLEFWVTSGILPLHLAETFMNAAKKGGADTQTLIKSMATKEIMQSIVFTNAVVKRTAVEPVIVDVPTKPNEIGPDEVMICCYALLRDWQLKGGEEVARLGNFPTE